MIGNEGTMTLVRGGRNRHISYHIGQKVREAQKGTGLNKQGENAWTI